MDPAKSDFLFGQHSPGFDPDRQEDRHRFFIPPEEEEPGRIMQGAIRAAISDQIAHQSPMETWATVRRLQEMGLTNEQIMSQLSMAFTALWTAEWTAGEPYESVEYLDALSRLPLPAASKVRDCWEQSVLSLHPALPEQARIRVLELLEWQFDDPAINALLNQVLEQLIEQEILGVMVDTRLVHLDDLYAQVWLSHSLSAEELEYGFIDATGDLAPFCRRRHRQLTLPGGGEIRVVDSDLQLLWWGPDGWMSRFLEGDLIAVAVDGNGLVQIIPADPAEDPDLVARLRQRYDASVLELQLPPYVKDLVTALLAQERTSFSHPRWPLDDLLVEAGLEREGPMVAHDDQLWHSLLVFNMLARAAQRMHGDESSTQRAMSVISLALESERTVEELTEALKALSDFDLAEFVVEELCSELFADDDDDDQGKRRGFVADLLRVGRTGTSRAVACWVAARICEAEGDCLAAEVHLKHSAGSGAEWGPALERMAWYESDRGNARNAVNLLERMPEPPGHLITILSGFVREDRTGIGRNEPCWCGSGRKYKKCHLSRQEDTAATDSVGWLYLKAVWYLEHQGPQARKEILELVVAAEGEGSLVSDGLKNPLVVDLALSSGGWFEGFVADRGDLLPEDELALAHNWLEVGRTVYQVERELGKKCVILRDLDTEELVQIPKSDLGDRAAPGLLVCGRAVSTGQGHGLIGAHFTVHDGTEGHVLGLCAPERSLDLCAWVAEQEFASPRQASLF